MQEQKCPRSAAILWSVFLVFSPLQITDIVNIKYKIFKIEIEIEIKIDKEMQLKNQVNDIKDQLGSCRC